MFLNIWHLVMYVHVSSLDSPNFQTASNLKIADRIPTFHEPFGPALVLPATSTAIDFLSCFLVQVLWSYIIVDQSNIIIQNKKKEATNADLREKKNGAVWM